MLHHVVIIYQKDVKNAMLHHVVIIYQKDVKKWTLSLFQSCKTDF